MILQYLDIVIFCTTNTAICRRPGHFQSSFISIFSPTNMTIIFIVGSSFILVGGGNCSRRRRRRRRDRSRYYLGRPRLP